MKGNFDPCLKELLIHEGGFSNHKDDPGGVTNLGVTKRVYEEWVGHPVSVDIMRRLNTDSVKALYKTRYWNALQCDELPIGLDLCMFDFGVNAGVGRSARYLQRLVGATADGVIGPKTLSLVQQLVKSDGPSAAIVKFQDMRRDYYKQLPTFKTFGKGWLRRVDEIEKAARAMAKGL